MKMITKNVLNICQIYKEKQMKMVMLRKINVIVTTRKLIYGLSSKDPKLLS